MNKVCVFCGSSLGLNPAYAEAARILGMLLAVQGTTLVYGGASVGIMGQLADAVLEHGGKVIGVIPEVLVAKEVSHPGLSELIVVGSMHERKTVMAELADGFIALPGGLGTLEELFEILTWAQLGLHGKPCGLLNIAGYYDALLQFLDHAVAQQLVSGRHRALLTVCESPAALMEIFVTLEPQAAFSRDLT